MYQKIEYINVFHHIEVINKRRNLARGVWRDTGISNHIDDWETRYENSRLIGLKINKDKSAHSKFFLLQGLSIYQLSYVTWVRTNPVMVRYVLLQVFILFWNEIYSCRYFPLCATLWRDHGLQTWGSAVHLGRGLAVGCKCNGRVPTVMWYKVPKTIKTAKV